MKKTTYILLSIAFPILLNSCVNEDDVFNDDITNLNQTTIKTSLITTLLNEKFTINSVDTESCLGFNFPIEVVYNTDQIVSVNNYDGLETVANSQTTNFHINGIALPFNVNKESSASNITTINEFNELLNSCEIPSLKNTILTKSSSCFTLNYPLTILNTEEEQEIIENNENFISFLENTNSNYIPEFIFPIQVNETSIVNNEFDLYQVLNNCEIIECTTLSLFNEEIETNKYLFDTRIDNLGDNIISWTIDNNPLVNETNTSIEYTFFNTGTYEVCVTLTTDNIDCIEQQVICNTIEIDCPSFEILSDVVSNDKQEYSFIINPFNSMDSVSDIIDLNDLIWTVQKVDSNDPLMFNEGDIEVTYSFTEPGTYEICADTPNDTGECTIDSCLEIEIEVNNICPPTIEISKELISVANNNDHTYVFTASGAGDNVKYVWDLSEGFDPESVSGEFDQFLESSFSEGFNEICVSVEVVDCSSEVVEQCIDIFVEL